MLILHENITVMCFYGHYMELSALAVTRS